MDAFLGTWNARPEDIENAEEYLKALNQPAMAEEMKTGSQLTVTKDGSDYRMVHNHAGSVAMQEVLHADGKVTFESQQIPADAVKVTHKMDGDKLVVEGTVGGIETRTVCSIEGGKMVNNMTTAGVSMKSTYTKA